jgi:DNA-binding NarL/FixJ family response regulator
MDKKQSLVLLIIEEINLQSGLVALLTTIPRISAVLVSENSISALKLLKNHRPGLVILDMSLEKDVVEKIMIQIQLQFREIKTLILTDSNLEKEKAKNLHADSYISKGFSAEVFEKKLHELLEEDR